SDLYLGGNRYVILGCSFPSDRAGSGAARIYRYCRSSCRYRKVPVLPVPCDVPDLLDSRHLGRKKGRVISLEGIRAVGVQILGTRRRVSLTIMSIPPVVPAEAGAADR